MKCLVIQKEKKIVLISTCANPDYVGQEEMLLKGCEKYINEAGFKRIAPKDDGSAELEECMEIYEKQGMHLYRYVEMDMPLAGYKMPQMQVPENITFDFYEGSMEKLHEAVALVEEEWVQYFSEKDRVFCGYAEDEIVCFCIVGYDEDCVIAESKTRIGSVGCVGTMPKYRKQGIGLYMVALATQKLKEAGCDRGFIHYTALENWYAKLGYQSFMSFYM